MRKIIYITLFLGACNFLISCNKYLDIVPDNVPTIDYAFRMRSTAERFLFTCYSYMPKHGSVLENPGFAAGDEIWFPSGVNFNAREIAKGNQTVGSPYLHSWQGINNSSDLYEGIRQCNIFLENIDIVPGMDISEKDRWIAEVKFLKAYYHFWLIRMYGPIVLVKENISISVSTDEVFPPRTSVDECFAYVVELLDECYENLPDQIENRATELGRISKAIALSVKAKVLITAASPLFNGNNDYTGYSDPQGNELFNSTFELKKWEDAAEACKEAIEYCLASGHTLYYFYPSFFQYTISDSTRIKMNVRNSVTEQWNSEIIWGDPNSRTRDLQLSATARGLDPEQIANSTPRGTMAPTLKIAEMFYSSNGVPITEDTDWIYSERFKIQTVGANHRFYLKEGYTTAKLNFDREPRFYADLGFDGGIWYGQGRFDDNNDPFYISSRKGQPAAMVNALSYSVTGYWPKKLVNFNNIIGDGTTYTTENYPWPVIRLADLYLLYSEALNELNGPDSDVYRWINLVRDRAGLLSVEKSWEKFSRVPGKYKTKEGMREIIHRERLIELAFEAQRFWDLRRWKEAAKELNKPITGWDVDQEEPEFYYREKTIFNQQFTTKDYLWPISQITLNINKKINQNPGW